jgi:hypothetical protein
MINRKHKIIKKITGAEIAKINSLSVADRVLACNPSTPQGFVRFMTYYFNSSIKYAYADFHYDMMEVLWIITQGKDIKKSLEKLKYSQKEIDEYLEGIPKYLDEMLAIGFRQCAKTTVIKFFLVYCICYDLRKYINVDAYDATNSERILFDVVTYLQTNQRIINDFGNLYNAQRSKNEVDQKRVTDFVTNKTFFEDGTTGGQIRVEAHTTQTSVRGRLHNDKRPDMIWFEDFETETTVLSESVTAAIGKHMQSFKGGAEDEGNWVLYSVNYLSEFCNVQLLIDKSEKIGTMAGFIIPIYDENMNLLWPEKYVMTNEEVGTTGKVSVQSKKEKMWTPEKGDQDFTMEMLCKPIDFSIQEFKKTMLKYITWEELSAKRTVLYITIDSGGSSKDTQRKKQGAVDDTGICYNFIDEYGNWHIKTEGKKMDAKEIMEIIFGNNLAYKNLEMQAIEKTMFVEAIKPFYDEAQQQRGQYPILQMLNSGGRNKENRIRGLIPRFEAGTIFLIEGENTKLEEQLLRFPRSKHDDVSDALAYQNDIAKIPTFTSYRSANGFYENAEENYSPFSDIGL